MKTKSLLIMLCSLLALSMVMGTANASSIKKGKRMTITVKCMDPADAIGAARTVLSSETRFENSKLSIYGDSLTVQSWTGLANTEPAYAVDAVWGRDIKATVAALLVDIKVHSPEVIVLAAGTNNMTSPYTVRTQLALARRLVPATTRLIWVDVWRETEPAASDALNSYVAGLEGVEYVPWSEYASANPALLIDGTHLTPAGCNVRNGAIRRQIVYIGAYPS